MERFKLDNFARENRGDIFPAFRTLGSEEANHTLFKLKIRLGLPDKMNAQDVLKAIDERSFDVSGVDATEEAFDLRVVLSRLGFSAELLLVNWYAFDKIDEFRREDLCNVFGDIFYPSADDVEILDSNLEWLVSIRHYGAVKALSIF